MKIHAQITNPIFGEDLPYQTGAEFFNKAIEVLITFLLVGGVIIFLIYFILGAYAWITSQGDKQKIQEAQKRITYALVGLAVIFSIFAVLNLIGFIFGIEGLQNLQLTLPTL